MSVEQPTSGKRTSDEENVGPRPENLKVLYQEVCVSLHKIDDFRGTLLGFLPLVSGAGIFLLLNNDIVNNANTKQFLLPIGLFGFVVTLGLFFYELSGIQRCLKLIEIGKKIERELRIPGQFVGHPPPLGYFIGPGTASFTVYPAVLAAWIYVALSAHTNPLWIAVGAFVAMLIIFTLFAWFTGLWPPRHVDNTDS